MTIDKIEAALRLHGTFAKCHIKIGSCVDINDDIYSLADLIAIHKEALAALEAMKSCVGKPVDKESLKTSLYKSMMLLDDRDKNIINEAVDRIYGKGFVVLPQPPQEESND